MRAAVLVAVLNEV